MTERKRTFQMVEQTGNDECSGVILRVWVLREGMCTTRGDRLKTLRYSVDMASSSLTVNL